MESCPEDKADAAFEYYFGKARLNTARTDGNIYSTPLDFPWEPEERTQSLDGKQYTEAAVLDYLDMLGANYAQAVIRAELGEFTKDLPQAPVGNAATSQSSQLPTIGETGSAFPDEFPAYAAALRDIVTITEQVNAPWSRPPRRTILREPCPRMRRRTSIPVYPPLKAAS